MTRTPEEVTGVLELVGAGLNDCEISRRTGIPRRTVHDWRAGRAPRRERRGSCFICHGYRFPVPNAFEYAYAYLLGLYLGDGHVASGPKGVYSLRIFLDRAYPVIIAECAAAIATLVPNNRVNVVRSTRSFMDIPSACSRHWPCFFPQHGPGPKHARPILLDPWQAHIVNRYPWRFLRGLIHSDGCRSLNTIRHPKKTYAYSRYQFTNHSREIRALFCEHCDRVGVGWTRMNRWTISIARRDSVALMDRYIGPKR